MFEKTLFGQLFSNLGGYLGHREEYYLEPYKNSKGVEEKKPHETLIWINVISISIIHLMTIFSFMYWRELTFQILAYSATIGFISGLGVTGGAHRLWCHRAYKAKMPLQIFLLICFTLSGQNSVYDWVRDHRVHHKFSETDADPHNVKRGFFFAHVGWLMVRKHPDVLEKGKTVDMSDIADDPLLAFQRKYFIPLKIFIAFLIPTIIPPLVWGEAWRITVICVTIVRYVWILNSTWLVNSAAHMFGNRPYDKDIKPTENLLVSILAIGEGWHNYHHVFPWDYKAAELGYYRANPTTLFLDIMARLGLAYDLKEPSKELILETARKKGDGSLLLAKGIKCEE